MFKIKNAVLTANGDFLEMALSAATAEDGTKLVDCVPMLSKAKNGINFTNPKTGALVCYGRFSAAVKKALIDKTLTLEQLFKEGRISTSDYEGETYYSLTIPEALRGGTALGASVKAIAAKAKPLVKKANITDISAELELA